MPQENHVKARYYVDTLTTCPKILGLIRRLYRGQLGVVLNVLVDLVVSGTVSPCTGLSFWSLSIEMVVALTLAFLAEQQNQGCYCARQDGNGEREAHRVKSGGYAIHEC